MHRRGMCGMEGTPTAWIDAENNGGEQKGQDCWAGNGEENMGPCEGGAHRMAG